MSSRNDCSVSHQFQGFLCPLYLPWTPQKIKRQSLRTYTQTSHVESWGKMDSETWRTFFHDNRGNLPVKKKKKNYGEEKLLGNCFQISPSKCPLAVKNPLCSCLDSQESSSQLHFLYHTLASQCVITRWIFPQSCYKLLMQQVVFWCSSVHCARTAQIQIKIFLTG